LQLILVRHGETEWNALGRFVGSTDLPLTPRGEQEATNLHPRLVQLLAKSDFRVFTSPLLRAQQTAALALPQAKCAISSHLREFDYGEFEGVSSEMVKRERPGWDIWRDGCPKGERLSDVATRAAMFLAELASDDTTVVFSHGYLLRVLTAVALKLSPEFGRPLLLDTGSISVVAQVRGRRAITLWNARD